jgi:hypothetical protein
MGKILGFCGLACNECPAFIATKDDDDAKREQVAKQWTKEYKHEFKTEDINCDGCTNLEGRHVGYCKMCEVRACAVEKKVKNCAYCIDYCCEILSSFLDMVPNAKESLEEIRENI